MDSITPMKNERRKEDRRKELQRYSDDEDLNKLQDALEDFSLSIGLNPELANTYGSRAVLYARMGKDDKAQIDMERAIELGANAVFLRTTIQEIIRSRH